MKAEVYFYEKFKNKKVCWCSLAGSHYRRIADSGQRYQDRAVYTDFFIDTNAPCVWHLQYQDDDGSRKNILTYRFVIDGGVAGGGSLGPDIGIDERQDSIVIIYDKEPLDGFTIEPGPFSDKIVLQKGASRKDIISAHCAME